jgi:hypothetical protein
MGERMFYLIAKEVLEGVRLDLIRVPPRVLMIPTGRARYTIIGIEYHADMDVRRITDKAVFKYARGESERPPDCLSISTWSVLVVFRAVKGARAKGMHLVHTVVAQNGGVFALADNDCYIYIDGDFESQQVAEHQRGHIVHAAVRHYLSFDNRSLDNFIPQHRSEFAHLVKQTA